MIIDAHVHYTPPSLKAQIEALADCEPYWHLLLNPLRGRSLQGWASAEQMIEDMDAAGLDRVLLVGEYFQQHDSCVRRNDQSIAIVHRWPERVLALATVQPNAGRAALDELDRCLDHGLVGVGELNPYAQGFNLDDRDFINVAEKCIDADVPLNLHVSEEIGTYYPGKSATPLRSYYDLICRLPQLKVILAHWGGGIFLYELMPRVRKQMQNVWYDTAATPLLYPVEQIFTTALTCIDPQKLLYGSDYPLLIYPSLTQSADFRPFLEALGQLNLEADIRADLMGRNAARLFGLLEAQPARKQVRKTFSSTPPKADAVTPMMSRGFVLSHWPEAEAIFHKYQLPTQEVVAPGWEPIQQAAAARGLTRSQRRALLEELNSLLLDE